MKSILPVSPYQYRGKSTALRLAGRIRQLRKSGKLIESFEYHGWTVLLEAHANNPGLMAVAELMFDGSMRCRMTRPLQLTCDGAVATVNVETRARQYIDRAVGSSEVKIDGIRETVRDGETA